MRATLKGEARRCIRDYAQLPGIALAPGMGLPALLVEPSSGLASAWTDANDSHGQGEVACRQEGGSVIGSLTRGQWVLHQPAQLAVVVSNLFWCQAVEAALEATAGAQGMEDEADSCGAGAALLALERCCAHQLEDLIRLVRGGLTELQRRVSTTCLHGRLSCRTPLPARCGPCSLAACHMGSAACLSRVLLLPICTHQP